MNVQIDPGAGPCFGVERAINMAEKLLKVNKSLICNGDLIHNEQEINRLKNKGLLNLSIQESIEKKQNHILFRAHGEAPSSYHLAQKNGISITDATCPIVKKLQQQIASTHQLLQSQAGRIVIYGQKNHPEVISLLGHCGQEALIIEKQEDLQHLESTEPIYLFSQTTKYQSDYEEIKKLIEEKLIKQQSSAQLYYHHSSCQIVAKRDIQLQHFIKSKDLILFVSGRKSSNGKQLFQICKNSGIPSYFIGSASEIKPIWLKAKLNIGISGATSTPLWLLNEVKNEVQKISSNY